MPSSITQNLNPAFGLRDYQKEAFASFIHYFNNDLPGKEKPAHLLFNMATGSGKTLIMAGLILYLYEKGYRNFLFFVNSTNIIEKTKDNFLNPRAAKYLFSQDTRFEGKAGHRDAGGQFRGRQRKRHQYLLYNHSAAAHRYDIRKGERFNL